MSAAVGAEAIGPRRHRLSAGVIVEQAGRLLLVHAVSPGRHDFWVAPGGGVQGSETLAEAAQREAFEEAGLQIEPGRLAYIEELIDGDTRVCKFWFIGHLRGGTLSTAHPQARTEGIVEAAWVSQAELAGRTVFPEVLRDRYWTERDAGWPAPILLPLHRIASG